MSQKFTIILTEEDHHNVPIRGKFKAKQIAENLYGKGVELLLERIGPDMGDRSYTFIRKDKAKEETS